VRLRLRQTSFLDADEQRETELRVGALA